MNTVVLPGDALVSINKHLYGLVWFRGASLYGIGPDATIEVHSSSLEEASRFLKRVDARWKGYPVRIRRASK